MRIGINSRLDTLQAAVLQVKLRAFKEYELERINDAAERYTQKLRDLVHVPVIKKDFYSSWAQYSILLKNEKERNSLKQYLKEKDIPSMIYYSKPMSRQTAFAGMECIKTDLSVSQDLCRRVLALPIHPYMQQEEQDKVIFHIRSFLENGSGC